MRLLDRYLLRELLVPLAFCLCGFLIFWIAFDLFGRLSDYQNRGLLPRDVAEYYLVRIPDILVLILPIVLLLALLYALTNHSRHNELTAIRAAGVSLWRICVPYVAVGLLLSAALFAINELCVPGCLKLSEQILHRREAARTNVPDNEVVSNLGLKNGRDGRTWLVETYNLKTGLMSNRVEVDWMEADGSRCQLVARRGEYRDGVWLFGDAVEFTNGVVAAQTNELAVPEFSETPVDFRRENQFNKWFSETHDPAQPVQIPLGTILDYLSLHPELSARNKCELHTQLQERLATPWTCLVVVLIAIPFGAVSGRRNVFVGVASSIGIVFAFYVLQRIGLAMGAGGLTPAWLAAWLPNAFFGLGGLWLMTRVR
jgi:lipopolysaccharide export system permease protein